MKALKYRFLAGLLVLCLLLSLAGCGAQGKPAESKAAAETGRTAAEREDGPGSGERNVGLAVDGPKAPEGGDSFDAGAFEGSFYYKGDDAEAPAAPGYAEADGAPGSAGIAEGGAGRTDSGEPIGLDDPEPPVEPSESGEPAAPDEPPAPDEPETSDDLGYVPAALKLTAAEWNDNANWPFFTNLVNAGTVSFPAFGIDPRNRVQVQVTNEGEEPLENQSVTLLNEKGEALWTARTDRDGTAYLFWNEGQTPERVVCGGAEAAVRAEEPSGDPQGGSVMRPLDSVALRIAYAAPARHGLQVLFIVDTTGSMADEIAYLQKDFSAIAERVGSEGVQWSVSFYRDEGDDYVTRHNPFTSDVAEIQRKLNAEYADGGGDEPEAVARVLRECLSERSDWESAAAKLAFLIFDAPPHEGTDEELRAAVKAAAEQGVRLIPVVASNARRDTELFGRALAICTNGTYVFLTDDSGVGDSHLEPIVGDYEVELLQDLIVRIIERYR